MLQGSVDSPEGQIDENRKNSTKMSPTAPSSEKVVQVYPLTGIEDDDFARYVKKTAVGYTKFDIEYASYDLKVGYVYFKNIRDAMTTVKQFETTPLGSTNLQAYMISLEEDTCGEIARPDRPQLEPQQEAPPEPRKEEKHRHRHKHRHRRRSSDSSSSSGSHDLDSDSDRRHKHKHRHHHHHHRSSHKKD